MTSETRSDDNLIKLYALLLDQLHKYSAIFWQFPLALIAANLFGIDKFQTNPFLLLSLSFFDATLFYAFYAMVVHSRELIAATQYAEGELKKTYGLFIPKFSVRKVKATKVTVISLGVLILGLFVYSVIRIYAQLNCPDLR